MCDFFEVEHLRQIFENHPFSTIKDLIGFLNNQRSNLLRLRSRTNISILPPYDTQSFVGEIQNIHYELFKSTGVLSPREFRTNPVFFGTGSNFREGVKPNEIVKEMEILWSQIEPYFFSGQYELGLSIFFPRFFRIHPFRDGNGRTARIFADIILAPHSKVLNLDSTSSYKKQYIKALKYAHRKFDSGVGEVNSIRYMRLFLAKYIRDKIPYGNIEEIDPDLRDD